MNELEFTPEQEAAMGHVIADNIGANMQTGRSSAWSEHGIPYIAVQHTPNSRVRWWYFQRDGTVEER